MLRSTPLKTDMTLAGFLPSTTVLKKTRWMPEVKVYSLSPMVEVKKVFEFFLPHVLVEAVGLLSKETYDYKP